ncbi:N-acetyltransferase eso1 [Entomophthora muscae]|uniref:N-acetyltransferase eso1 n=1 Tax=Entomophthora muscae TaxID=34485 RepID=A0ACC2TE88_9FUNG|nr:N-acetyltransferase eso1 [Entomophthora muscae]
MVHKILSSNNESDSSSQESSSSTSSYVLPNNRVLDGLFSDQSEGEQEAAENRESACTSRFLKRRRRFYRPETIASDPIERRPPSQDSPSKYVLPNNRVLDGLFSDQSEGEQEAAESRESACTSRFLKQRRRFYRPETIASGPNERSPPSQDSPSKYVLPNNRVLDGLFSDQSGGEQEAAENRESASTSHFLKRRRSYRPETITSDPIERSLPSQDSPSKEASILMQQPSSPFLDPNSILFNSPDPCQPSPNISLRSAAYYDDLIEQLTQIPKPEEPDCLSDEEAVEEFVEEVYQESFDVSSFVNPFTQAPSVEELVNLSPKYISEKANTSCNSSAQTSPSQLNLTGKSAYSQMLALEKDLGRHQTEDQTEDGDGLEEEGEVRVSDPLTQYRSVMPTNFDEWLESSLKVVATLLKGSRCIAHVDLDCFYAQVEQVRIDVSGDVPVAVQQWNGLLAINYAARKFGITRMETPADAKRKCRELLLVHVPTYAQGSTEYNYNPKPNFATHKASLAPYRQASARIFDIFKSFTPNVQKGGTDEAYIDLTDLVNARILKDCRATANFSPEPLTPLDWKGWGHVVQSDTLNADCSQGQHPAYHTDFATKYWRSRQLLAGAKIVARIRATVFSQLGYTCGAGISHNKHMAKLCSAQNKPNQQSILLEEATLPFLKDFPVTKIRFMAGKLGHRAAHLFGETCGEMWKHSLKDFQDALGRKDGSFVFDICRGINHKPVRPIQPMKSLMSGKSLIPPCEDFESLKRWLEVLGSELVFRLQEVAEDARWPKSLSVGLYCPSAPRGFQQFICPIPSMQAIDSNPNLITARAIAMCQEQTNIFPCKFLCLSALGLEDSATKTNTAITDFFAIEPNIINLPAQPEAPEQILLSPERSPPPAPVVAQDLPAPADLGHLEFPDHYVCPTCNKRLPLDELESHQDFHLALELQSKFDWEDQAFPPQSSRPPVTNAIRPANMKTRGRKRKRGASTTLARHSSIRLSPRQGLLTSAFPRSNSAQSNPPPVQTSASRVEEEWPDLYASQAPPPVKQEPLEPMLQIDSNVPRNSTSRARHIPPLVKQEPLERVVFSRSSQENLR